MSERRIPDDVLQKQMQASDPTLSVWVAANAGAGKTHALTQRVIRLLLQGVDPAKILCITFTKAAAANMATRVFNTLAGWTALTDTELDRKIRELAGAPPSSQQHGFARQLFASALETPGGLKVQTIHAFCARLLHQFPFEANVASRFEVLDDTTERQLLEQITLDVLLEGARAPDSSVGRALATAITHATDFTLREVINEAIDKRDAIAEWIDAAGGIEAAMAELCGILQIDLADTSEKVAAEFFSGAVMSPSQWQEVIEAVSQGSKQDLELAERIREATTTGETTRLNAYLEIFCRQGDLQRRARLATKTIERNHPDLFDRLGAEQDRVCALLRRRRAVAVRERTQSLLTITAAVSSNYQREKDRRGLLDYDDLIAKTSALLTSVPASWVLYKLDLGIDHILVDEAQDTSPAQWAIIDKIASEFAAGRGARGALRRTLFAVGDEKQSIFSFQGAEPREFDRKRRHYGALFDRPDLGWRHVPLRHSFRSGMNLLGAVDMVFARPEALQGLTADPVPPVHEPLPGATPGVVEIWDLLKPDAKPEIEGWDAPFDTVTETSPQVKLATRIARTAKAWIKQGRKPGDILILVRQRGPIFGAIISALKKHHVEVAGADRLTLTEHIAVMDLLALADALLLPDDDLALATALRSPLFGFTEEQLFTLAWNREASLRTTLRTKAADDLMFHDASARLDALAEAAHRDTPFAFYARLLGPERGRRRILGRLGHEAVDALDEFLNLALDYERRETPSLQGFLAWLRAANAEVKRDMEIARDEVRVMTVHGAKGLEAPVVILADTTTRPTGARDPRLLTLPSRAPGRASAIVWSGKKADDVEPIGRARDTAQEAAREEYRRLLYVGMTRASEHLVIAGIEGERQRPQGCWYNLVWDALTPHAVTERADDGEHDVHRFCKVPPLQRLPSSVAAGSAAAEITLPDWLGQNVEPHGPTAILVTPSSVYPDTDAWTHARRTTASAAAQQAARTRGILVHRLMQALPEIVPERRADAARRYLARTGDRFTQAERDGMVERVLALLNDARFAPLFAAGSRAEVPIVGRIERPAHAALLVSGQVDRLVVTADSILIADYKTNRPAPRKLEDVPPSYLGQLAAYQAVLSRLYPGRAVRTALVWTEVPDLMEISAEILEPALAQITSAS